jgi:hypothetical protein
MPIDLPARTAFASRLGRDTAESEAAISLVTVASARKIVAIAAKPAGLRRMAQDPLVPFEALGRYDLPTSVEGIRMPAAVFRVTGGVFGVTRTFHIALYQRYGTWHVGISPKPPDQSFLVCPPPPAPEV